MARKNGRISSNIQKHVYFSSETMLFTCVLYRVSGGQLVFERKTVRKSLLSLSETVGVGKIMSTMPFLYWYKKRVCTTLY